MRKRIFSVETSMLLLLVLLLLWIRVQQESFHIHQQHIHSWSAEHDVPIVKAISGPLPGLMADFYILDVFSIYYEANTLSDSTRLAYLEPYLETAQSLDPQFFDTYRLAESLLAYDAQQAEAAVSLLRKGGDALPDVWEFPFVAGFIAHDSLQDDKLAFELMSQVATRENTPVMVITLASRFLASTSTTADAMMFLKGLLFLLPRDKQDGVRARIKALEAGEPALPATN